MYKRKKYSQRGQFDFSRQEVEKEMGKVREGARRKLEAPEDMLIEEHSEDVLLSWRAPEFEMLERDRKWYFWVTAILLVIIAYAIITNGLVMAITFILVGIVGYIYINKEPRELNFMITEDGVVAGKEIYEFKNLQSFWIFREPHQVEILTLHTKSFLAPYVHIPVHDQDPEMLKQILRNYLSEEKKEPGAVETLERLLRL